LIAAIRSTGAGLCNNDFYRDSHCDVACASATGSTAAQLRWSRHPGFHSSDRVGCSP
jgi:hypothetical protein